MEVKKFSEMQVLVPNVFKEKARRIKQLKFTKQQKTNFANFLNIKQVKNTEQPYYWFFQLKI